MDTAIDFRKVTLHQGVIGTYDVMSKMHGNETYPDSRRIYSRPYACFLTSHDKDPIAKFRDALHDFGEAFIGEPFMMTLDINGKTARCMNPAFWDEKIIYEFLKTKEFAKMIEPAPHSVALAYKTLGDQVAAHGSQIPGVSETQIRRYDRAILGAALDTIWQHDWMFDPRLTMAEDIFFCYPHSLNTKFSSLSRDEDVRRFKDSMDWMQRMENADRVARAFLYSRMSQHLGETNPDVARLAESVHEQLKTQSVISVPALRGRFNETVRSMLVGELTGGPSTLARSWPQIVEDHKILRDGTFAREALSYALKFAGTPEPRAKMS